MGLAPEVRVVHSSMRTGDDESILTMTWDHGTNGTGALAAQIFFFCQDRAIPGFIMVVFALVLIINNFVDQAGNG